MIVQASEPLVQPSEVAIELVGFLGTFALYGAVGYRIAAGALHDGFPALHGADRRAATLGAAGVLLSVVALLVGAAGQAAEHHQTLGAALAGAGGRALIQLALLAVALFGAVIARAGMRVGWWFAGAAVAALALRGIASGKWTSLVNPLHVLAGGFWLGTLAVLVIAAFPVLIRGDAALAPGSRLSPLIARFSRLALVSSGLLAVTGVITAWRHLKRVDALWTSPYGLVLCVKLVIVVAIVALGAYNWRVVTPALVDDAGDAQMVRSSRREVLLAVAILLVTAVLVSVPPPGRDPRGGPPAVAPHIGPPAGLRPSPAGAPETAPNGHRRSDNQREIVG